jgi:hypothetical protein
MRPRDLPRCGTDSAPVRLEPLDRGAHWRDLARRTESGRP